MGQKGVLLGFVEAMDLIHEENGSSLVEATLSPSFFNDPPHIFDSSQHGADGDEIGFCFPGDDSG
jgi:hypothetical protein